MKQMLTMAVAIWLAAVGSRLMAADMAFPELDIAVFCNNVTRDLGTIRADIRKACIENEERALKGARPEWNTASDIVQRHCANVVRQPALETYIALWNCLRNPFPASQ